MTERTDGFEWTEISVSSVIKVAGGQYNIQVDTKELLKVFGRFGLGAFKTVENGFEVSLGPANQLLLQVPRIQFKAASEDILIALYENGLKTVMGPFMGKSAVAFGINFEFDVRFSGVTTQNALRGLGSTQLGPGILVTTIGLQKPPVLKKQQLNCVVGVSPEDPQALRFQINNHIPEPNKSCLSVSELKTEIAAGREDFINFLRELEPCVRPTI